VGPAQSTESNAEICVRYPQGRNRTIRKARKKLILWRRGWDSQPCAALKTGKLHNFQRAQYSPKSRFEPSPYVLRMRKPGGRASPQPEEPSGSKTEARRSWKLLNFADSICFWLKLLRSASWCLLNFPVARGGRSYEIYYSNERRVSNADVWDAVQTLFE
jgi:hypothetical protein